MLLHGSISSLQFRNWALIHHEMRWLFAGPNVVLYFMKGMLAWLILWLGKLCSFLGVCGEVGVPVARTLTELKPPDDVTGLLLGYCFHNFRQ